MARINGVSSARAGLYVKIAYHFTQRSIAKLTGRQTEQMIKPLGMYAHLPVLFKGYAKLEQATARLHRLDNRLHALAELTAATLIHCEYRIDMGLAISRRLGLTDEEILALPAPRRARCSPSSTSSSSLRSRHDPHPGTSPRRTVRQASPASRRRPDRGIDAPHRPGEHARPLQPSARDRLGRLQQRHGLRRPRGGSVSRTTARSRADGLTLATSTTRAGHQARRMSRASQAAFSRPRERIICALKRNSAATLPHARNRRSGVSGLRELAASSHAVWSVLLAACRAMSGPRGWRLAPVTKLAVWAWALSAANLAAAVQRPAAPPLAGPVTCR